jgi:hypothetical protein
MADRPILFSAAMVRALLAGTKTQTRRIIKDAPTEPGWICYEAAGERKWIGPNGYPSMPCALRFAKGDRLYVREHWRTESRAYDDLAPSEMDADYPVIYEADADWSTNKTVGRFRQGMHMPRWASRLTLTVTDVRVQRLQEISEEDAKAEGLEWVAPTWGIEGIADSWDADPVIAYAWLWESINGDGAWDANPWIVAVSFSVEKVNIDAVRDLARKGKAA